MNRLDHLWEALDDLTDWLIEHPGLPREDGTRKYAADLATTIGGYYNESTDWVRGQEMLRRRLREKLGRTRRIGELEGRRING